jgi:hypothetical protein
VSRRVVLVDLYWTRDKDPRMSLGHASLLAALRREPAVHVAPLVFPVNDERTTAAAITAGILDRASGAAAADVDVAIGAYVWNESLLRAVLPGLRAAGFAGRIILGGPQVSYVGAGLEAMYPDVDVFVRGYGEQALCALVRSGRGDQAAASLAGVHVAGAQDANTQARIDLQGLPSPWLDGTVPVEGQRFLRWETQRGCPYRCSFCQHREPGARLVRRGLLMSRVMAEADLFCRARIPSIAVLDPIFNINAHAAQVLGRFAGHGFAGRLSLQCRAELVDEPFLEAASALDVCLELGLQTIHQAEGDAIERRNDVEKVDRVLGQLRARGIDHEVSVIFGQTLASFEATVSWCLERRVPRLRAFPLLLLRGTALERDRERWGFVTDDGPMAMAIASSSFTHQDWLAMARTAEALRATEGHHPTDLRALRRLAQTCCAQSTRWRPEA